MTPSNLITSPHPPLPSHQAMFLDRAFCYLITRDGLRNSHSLPPNNLLSNISSLSRIVSRCPSQQYLAIPSLLIPSNWRSGHKYSPTQMRRSFQQSGKARHPIGLQSLPPLMVVPVLMS